MLIHLEGASGGLVVGGLRDLEQLLLSLLVYHLGVSSNLVVSDFRSAEEGGLVSHDILKRSLDVLDNQITYSVLTGSKGLLSGGLVLV